MKVRFIEVIALLVFLLAMAYAGMIVYTCMEVVKNG
jgi:hypothetical protein